MITIKSEMYRCERNACDGMLMSVGVRLRDWGTLNTSADGKADGKCKGTYSGFRKENNRP